MSCPRDQQREAPGHCHYRMSEATTNRRYKTCGAQQDWHKVRRKAPSFPARGQARHRPSPTFWQAHNNTLPALWGVRHGSSLGRRGKEVWVLTSARPDLLVPHAPHSTDVPAAACRS
ncbi:hypothetical protein HAX54_019012 [Datura stramonium]|uniref:Uncharacterized protein n=1 Tax=Datura stramonium TaxID=4076 RepID=A0ABS8UNI7_DATST|nr:hypothetical protein [Datura stramonium]